MRAHSKSTLPNSPNYYWDQAIIHDALGQNDWVIAYLFLFYMSTLGE